MATKLEVINRALSRIGVARIGSLADTTVEALAVLAAWEQVRREVQRDHSWNCLSVRVAIVANATAPAFGFGKRYALPATSLRILEVLSSSGGATEEDWVVENGWILTDLTTDLRVRYLKDSDDPTEWDAILTSAVAARLAAEVAVELRGSQALQDQWLANYKMMIMSAKMADAQEQSPVELAEDDWVAVRV